MLGGICRVMLEGWENSSLMSTIPYIDPMFSSTERANPCLFFILIAFIHILSLVMPNVLEQQLPQDQEFTPTIPFPIIPIILALEPPVMAPTIASDAGIDHPFGVERQQPALFKRESLVSPISTLPSPG